MQIFTVRANLDRVILLVYRLQPDAIQPLLPATMKLRTLAGHAFGGVLLARRRDLRTRLVRAAWEGTQFAVHYLNVVDAQKQRSCYGTYVIRRDTTSRLNALLAPCGPRSRLHHASFRVAETGPTIDLEATGDDRQMHLHIAGHLAAHLSPHSVFLNTDQACSFLRDGLIRLGIVVRHQQTPPAHPANGRCRLVPMHLERFESSVFDSGPLSTETACHLDSAFWLQDVEHTWDRQCRFCCDIAPA